MPTAQELVSQVQARATASGRVDLGERLAATAKRMTQNGVRVLVVGEFKQGKSMLVNALVEAPACPVDDDIPTAIPTVVSHGDNVEAALVFTSSDEGSDPTQSRVELPLDQLAERTAGARRSRVDRRISHAEVRLPAAVLEGGLVVVDTPGVGGLGSTHHLRTLSQLPTADAVLLVTDASQEFSGPELEFLRQAMHLCPNVACVLTKTDMHPSWRQVMDLDLGHLTRAGLSLPVVPVSSLLRLHAIRNNDAELTAESGIPVLAGFLRDRVVRNAAMLRRISVAHDLTFVLDNLSVTVRAEKEGLEHPDRAKAILAEFEQARQDAENLRKRSARWQVTLGDGINDLISDLEYDLRDRTRKIAREAEIAIDNALPELTWEAFAEWVEVRVAAAVSDNLIWAHERALWLSDRIAEHFRTAVEFGDSIQLLDADNALSMIGPLTRPDVERMKAPQKLLVGMRGSYGGVLMFGLITGVITGLPLINPISLGAGILIGTKTYRDDRKVRVKRQQAESKSAIRLYIDEIGFQVGKQTKDWLRQVQRLMRDHYSDLADQMHNTMNDAVKTAQQLQNTRATGRDARIRQLNATLGEFDKWAGAVAALKAGK